MREGLTWAQLERWRYVLHRTAVVACAVVRPVAMTKNTKTAAGSLVDRMNKHTNPAW